MKYITNEKVWHGDFLKQHDGSYRKCSFMDLPLKDVFAAGNTAEPGEEVYLILPHELWFLDE